MLTEKIQELLQEQINREFYSAYLYLDFSNHYNEVGLDGFGHWYYLQAKEEMEHARQFMDYLHKMDVKVQLKAIAQPDKKIKKVLDGVEMALEHERFITASIENIYAVAPEAKDYKTLDFIQGLVREQVEEEDSARILVDKVKAYGDDPSSLYLLNQELRGRA